MSEFGVLSESTPPRPRRSSRRKPPPAELASPTASTPVSPPLPSPRTPRSPTSRSISVDISGASLSSGKDSLSPFSSHLRTPLRYRELEASRTPLSEREKAVKWDDLLERSNRAGGTLHLGETGLMSDNIRFSDYSGISDSR
ncbi:hypothetical protein NM688_g8245 [Phlebia brevispora]|uniref:Uncharacterized protein n=1 Tax=Phlebia brevispora TaxID=194682 RepID=A0ACC1RVG3_9APHY|nr:hypothetical protein NM688_g8245 [Phlebia brevispora]